MVTVENLQKYRIIGENKNNRMSYNTKIITRNICVVPYPDIFLLFLSFPFSLCLLSFLSPFFPLLPFLLSSVSFLLFYSYLILLFLFTKLCQCLLSCRSCFYNISSAFSLVTVIPKHCLRDYVIFYCIYSFPKCCSSLSSFFFFLCHYIML